MRRYWPVILLLASCGAGPATRQAEPSNQTAEVLRKIRSDADNARAEIEFRPTLGEKPWDEVLQLDYSGPALVARTRLLPQFGRARSLNIAGDPGICVVEFRSNRLGTPLFFKLKRVDSSDSDFPLRIADLAAMQGKTELTHTLESVQHTIMVQLIDDRQNPEVRGPHPNGECRLFIDITNTADEAPLRHIQFYEADLPGLIWAHRALCDQFVRPMLRDLGQERLMRLDLAVARQVLAGKHVQVDPAVADEVRDLVTKLDSDDFKERRSASDKLKHLGLPGARAMMELDHSKMTPEQRNRVNEAIDANRPLKPADVERLGSDTPFLIDCLELEDDEVRDAAISKLERLTHKKPKFNPKAGSADQMKSLDALRRELIPFPTTQPQ